MVSPVERYDLGTPGRLARQLQRRLDGVGTGRAGELDLVVPAAWLEQVALDRFQELALGGGVQVEGVGHAVGRQIRDQRIAHARVVVAIVQGAGAGEEVQVFAAIFAADPAALGGIEHQGQVAAVHPHVGLEPSNVSMLFMQTS